MARGLWKGTYAATNPGEYWAESVQDWFDNNRSNDALHNHVHTRKQLLEYDPDVAKLCREVYGDIPRRYQNQLTVRRRNGRICWDTISASRPGFTGGKFHDRQAPNTA